VVGSEGGGGKEMEWMRSEAGGVRGWVGEWENGDRWGWGDCRYEEEGEVGGTRGGGFGGRGEWGRGVNGEMGGCDGGGTGGTGVAYEGGGECEPRRNAGRGGRIEEQGLKKNGGWGGGRVVGRRTGGIWGESLRGY